MVHYFGATNFIRNLNWHAILTNAAIVGGISAGPLGIGALVYNRLQAHYSHKQLILMQEQERARQAEAKEDQEWSERFHELAMGLSHIPRTMMVQPRGENIHIPLYPTVFSDPHLREQIETYIVIAEPAGGRLTPRSPRPDELKRAALRQTIENAERAMQSFRENRPNVPLDYYMQLR